MYPRIENWHKDFVNMPLVIKALEKTYADSGQNINSRWDILSGELSKLIKQNRLFTKYAGDDFPPKEHKRQIIKMFSTAFLRINGAKITTK